MKIDSWSKTDRPVILAVSASIAVLTPGEPKPSSNSLQPTMPSSVVILQKW